jgi:tetratricopeptide (TPR) repeat protein
MKNNLRHNFISIAVIVLSFVAVFGLSNFLEKSRPPLPEGLEDQDLALNGAKLKGYTLGFEGLMADWYWMQSLQYIGNKVVKSDQQVINLENLRPLNPRLLYPLLDNATDLDPNFLAAYSYGAIVLPAIDADQAIKITEKGIRQNPKVWRLYQHLGYIYWRMKNYEKASEVYQQGAKIEGAPPFMQMMAAQMKTQGGSRETSRKMYEQMFAEAQDDQTKETAAIRLLELDSFDQRDLIRSALEDFQAKNNRCPSNWREIFPLLRPNKSLVFDASTNAPLDPSNAPYVLLNSGKCEVSIDGKISKIPVE